MNRFTETCPSAVRDSLTIQGAYREGKECLFKAIAMTEPLFWVRKMHRVVPNDLEMDSDMTSMTARHG
jgi:hypothetical protein